MARQYTVFMEHRMRSVQTVVAENEEEAKEKAKAKSFGDDANVWEEHDTEFWRVDDEGEAEAEDECESCLCDSCNASEGAGGPCDSCKTCGGKATIVCHFSTFKYNLDFNLVAVR